MQLAALILLLIPAPAQERVQTWEKLIAPGVTYRMEVDPTIPRIVHAVRISPQAEGVKLLPELAQGQVFNPDREVLGRETVSAISVRTNALLTVNADFFPLSGDPLGAMVRGGELLSSPVNGRSAIFWGPDGFDIGYLTFSGSVSNGTSSATLYGVNEECGDDMVVLNTPKAAFALSREPATHAVLELVGKISPKGEWTGKIKKFIEETTQVPVGDNEIVLTYRGPQAEIINSFELGQEITVTIECKGTDWEKTTDAIGGGPFILRRGEEHVTFAEEGFREGFSTNRHPRTAVGKTENGDVWIVAIDGRQAMSAGASLPETAAIMKRLGCVDAINLDGGGSTTMNLGGVTINRPSGGQERAVANALLVMVALLDPISGADFVVTGKAEIKAGANEQYKVTDSEGNTVPNSEVIWSAHGSAWIDQAGVLHSFDEGETSLTALVKGKIVQITVRAIAGDGG